MNAELTAMLWGGLSGAAMFALGLYWLWDMKPSKFETELIKSDVKDLQHDRGVLYVKCQKLADRLSCLEHPPFKPKFGDMVMAERVDKSGLWPAVYLFSRDKLHRVVVRKVGGEVVEYFTDTIEPLEND